MDKLLRDRAELFGKYIGAEIKGAIIAQGHTQKDVAEGTGRQNANISRWLNGKPTIPVEVALEICDYIGIDLQKIVNRAQQRVEDELGPWPPITVNPAMLTEEGKKRIVDEKIQHGSMGLAALHDPDKDAGDGIDPEFA